MDNREHEQLNPAPEAQAGITISQPEPNSVSVEFNIPWAVAICPNITIDLVMGILFTWFTLVDEHNGEQCHYLKFWGLIYGLVSLFFTAVSLVVLCPAMYCFGESVRLKTVSFAPWSENISTVVEMFIIVLLTIFWFFKEPCGHLRILTGVYALIVWGLIGAMLCLQGVVMMVRGTQPQ